MGDRRLGYADIDRARTVFEWGPAARPTAGAKNTPKAKAKNSPKQKAAGTTQKRKQVTTP
jgi:hypothetical protein